MTLNELFQIPPYGLTAEGKEAALAEILSKLTRHHYEHCPEYHKIIDVLGFDVSVRHSCEQQPFLPVRLFKKYELYSVSKEQVTKTLTSSGTSGQSVSKIFLDADNVRSQSKTLNEIISSFIGKQRLPLLLLDTEMIKKDRSMYSARGAGIIGFSLFGRNITYALNADMDIDIEKVTEFCEKHADDTILMFGYTYMIWQFVVRALENSARKFHMKNAILFHIGGWKNLRIRPWTLQSSTAACRVCSVM